MPMMTRVGLLTVLSPILFLSAVQAALVDLTRANRRAPIPGLPDWSGAGFEGGNALPDDSRISRTITAAQLASQYGVIPDDGVDDTDGLQAAISSSGSASGYTLIQLPAGVINLSYTVYLDSSYVILRGAGKNSQTGTRIVFRPDANTRYDAIKNGQWELDGMKYSWEYANSDNPTGPGMPNPLDRGTAQSGWLWPGRSIFRIGSKKIAAKFTRAAGDAPRNRVDFFWGSVNYHWRIDKGSRKGFMASQRRDIAGRKGETRIYIHDAADFDWHPGADVWVASPVRQQDYIKWGVRTESYFVNAHVFQDWFSVLSNGTDANGPYIEVDHPLRFDVYANSTSGGSPVMEDTVNFAKIMGISDPIHHVGIENLYLTQPIDGLDPMAAEYNFGNMQPDQAMHGIVLRYARDCWIRNIATFMTGSHPVATEGARHIQVQDSQFVGAWNKGKGGNGYLRGSRVWDSLYYNITQRQLRHFTFQWSAMGNVATLMDVSNDLNLHGGWEAYNLMELNYVRLLYNHRSGSCTANCGGEGGASEGGTWWPIYWATGEKASKWSGATGPQNVFFRNFMMKQATAGGVSVPYTPYFSDSGSNSQIWQFGMNDAGTDYQHLALSPSCHEGTCLLVDWQGNERVDYVNSGTGVNADRFDHLPSLFFIDVSAAGNRTILDEGPISGRNKCLDPAIPCIPMVSAVPQSS